MGARWQFSWLRDGDEVTVRAALAKVAPELASASFVRSPRPAGSDPRWWASNAIVDGSYVVKFAWSEPAATRLHREITVLRGLAPIRERLRVPAVAFWSTSPTLLGTKTLPGASIPHADMHRLDISRIDSAAGQLAEFLAALHSPEVLDEVRDRSIPLATADPQGTTPLLRDRFPAVVTGERRRKVASWCDWVDDVLATPTAECLVHGDLHIHNLLWDRDTMRLVAVVDFETAAAADAEYDFRYMPREYDLFRACAARYEELRAVTLDLRRVMAWHILTSLGDALWRAEAGVAMPAGGATPDDWFDLVEDRLTRLGFRIAQ